MIYNDVRKNENKGFSLVELIVVVAIMAVLVAVLAPSLLAYVERSRAQKDTSAMSEVTNAIQLALADQDVYDEVLIYTIDGNYSCYVDKADANKGLSTHGTADTAEDTKEGAYWMYNDGARLNDEQVFDLAGKMRGATITFYPSASTKKSTIDLGAGIVNLNKESELTINGIQTGEGKIFKEMVAEAGAETYLYNRVRATVGDKIELTSQTYRNSAYTVFIRMGTTGGKETEKQDAIKVYGQWCGTNLDLDDVFASSELQIDNAANQTKPTD